MQWLELKHCHTKAWEELEDKDQDPLKPGEANRVQQQWLLMLYIQTQWRNER